MTPKIKTLTIERFRALRELRIDGFGQVNLITGRNNTGKSSLLEALRILAHDASPAVILRILQYREEDTEDTEDAIRTLDPESVLKVSSLFHGFPHLSDRPQPIAITSNGGSLPLDLKLEMVWVSEMRGPDGGRDFVPVQATLFGEGEGIPALVISTGRSKRTLPLEYFRRYSRSFRVRSDTGEIPRLPCVFVSPFDGERTANLGVLWDRIALTDRESDVVDALHIIDPRILGVSMIGTESLRSQRTAIVRASNLPRPVPLRSFGDGLNRLFGIVLSLVNAKDGLLLIDEFENGMHHSVQMDVWRAVFKLAKSLSVQVFATSHSWDAVEAFQRAASEVPEEGVLVRLSRRGDEIIPTIFGERELAVATRDRIEVR